LFYFNFILDVIKSRLTSRDSLLKNKPRIALLIRLAILRYWLFAC